MKQDKIIAVDIGGTNIKYALLQFRQRDKLITIKEKSWEGILLFPDG